MISDTTDFSFYRHFYQPHSPWAPIEENYCRLPDYYAFDLEQVRADFMTTSANFPLKPFEFTGSTGKARKRTSYLGLGLTSKIGPDSHYDALNLYERSGQVDIYNTFKIVSDQLPAEERIIRELDETDFGHVTQACSPLIRSILGKFKSPLLKVRFLELKPGGFIPAHVDFPYYKGIRLHAVLFSNDDVVWQVENETFKLPADGRFYWFDTGKYHSVANKGKTTRVVLSVNLSVYYNRDGSVRHGPDENLLDLMKQELI